MELESPELSRERAVSSEPCSTRLNPFDEDEHSARKRQRTSSGGSRSRSVDAARVKTARQLSATPEEANDVTKGNQQPPQTPTRSSSMKLVAEPTSSRVTINLRSTRPVESSLSVPPSPETPSKMVGQNAGLQVNIDKGDEAASLKPQSGTSSSSSSSSSVLQDIGSPDVELISVNEESGFGNRSPPVAIIEDDEDDEDEINLDIDPMLDFPFRGDEALPATARKIARYLEFEPVEDEETFCRLRDWIDSYLQVSGGYASSWFETYVSDREFWDLFPDIVWALSRRRNFFGQFMSRSREGRRSLSEFLCQFARLTARFVAMDVRTLTRNNDSGESGSEPILASRLYLQAFGWLLRKDEQTHIGRNLEAHYRWNWTDDVSMLMNTFLTNGGNIPTLTKLVQGQLALIGTYPKLIDNMTEPCRIVYRAVLDAAGVLHDPDRSHKHHMETSEQIISLAYQFYKAMSAGLIPIIEKHVTFLTPEAAMAHIIGLTSMLHYSLIFDGCPARKLLDDHHLKHPSLPQMYSGTVISTEWKFEILRKFIISGQMQLRVIGVTNMCTDLLSMYKENKREDPAAHPVLLHFANFILDNKLVDYIIGIGSHPEIIIESYNIVGFLVATKTYTTQQTDKIWQTVTTSQDPRVVEAILRMLGQILNLYDYESLLYLCKMVGELPLESFTVPMRDYCEQLLRCLISRSVLEKAPSMDAPPYELCVRLIRESSIARPDAQVGSLDVQLFAATRLRELIVHGPEAGVRNSIYVSCIEDISNRTQTAPGSICAILHLLRQNLATDLHILTTNHGLTRLMVEELEITNMADQATSVSSSTNSPARNARRELLLAIINHEPSTITAELGIRLWNSLVGQAARSSANREIGWQILNSAAKKNPSNIFVTTCFTEYLPKLDPECYTLGSLDFARASIVAWLGGAHGDLLEEEQLSTLSGVEQLWRMILKAPANSIEAPAVNMIVELYVDSAMISNMPRTRAHSVHLALVNRCLDQLSSAAKKLKCFSDGNTSGEDESMVVIASEDEIHEQELTFTRSLIILREFLRSYQSKPHYMLPKPRSPILNVPDEVVGESFNIKYQVFDGESSEDVKELTIGKQNTVATLFATVQKVTGFKGCKIYHWGKEVDLDETDLMAALEDLKIGMGLLLVRRSDDGESIQGRLRSRSSTIELEIIKQFDNLWDYLGMEEKLSKEIYYFLIKFPVYSKLLAAFNDESASCADIFPLGKPFKCLYAIHALREHISAQSQQGISNAATLSKSISLIVSAITKREVLESCTSGDLRIFLALHLTECLAQLLREPVPAESLSSYLDNALFDRLLELLYLAKAAHTVQTAIQLVASAFEAILEASFHSPQFWSVFIAHPHTAQLLQDLLLEEPRTPLRKSIMKQVTNKCLFTPSLSSLSTTDFAVALWPLLERLVPKAVLQPHKCEETLTLALLVFRKLADTSIESVDVEGCLLGWGSLLVEHKSQEDVGHPESVDVVSRSLANLLYWCASFAKASQRPLPANKLAVQIFRRHLFQELTTADDDETIIESLPLLNTATRKLMADIIIFLTKDDRDQYQQVIELLADLVPFNHDDEMPYCYELPFAFDRMKAIRSPTGYVGLRNLSNTCYLNSLFTQLFMNISFRGFMLKANVADSGTSQKLLYETQKLFTYMQNSLKRYVDPTNLAASIRTYDDTGIDVSVQMDVDEFYNLLFDRWESQILTPADKRTFRSFYGGQLVQQVKSKECPHISERLEPFSAIQCDIKGKTSLQESLQAYVDGEIMEGDNKYKCSTCDRHVNAVKRACLKDIPNNLIFHLKRFDFNLRTMQRSKINDYFNFPHRIDMRPYKVEHLMESPEQTEEDIYELVGILVHAGTAESGHYYSYIRERPSYGQSPSWVEFNDDSVTSFDPSCIDANCFGGPDYRGPDGSGPFQFDKSYSAYMLFYQRSSVLQAQQRELYASSAQQVRVPFSRGLSNHIAQENELLIRKYCLYDDGHAPFVLRMLDNAQHVNKGRCSEDHVLEKNALFMTLYHLDQVICRTKDLPDLPSAMVTLNHKLQACAECSLNFLEWVICNPEAFRQLLFRNPDQVVRNDSASALVHALSKVKHDASYSCYGLYDDSLENDDDDSDLEYTNPRIFIKVLTVLRRFWETFHLSTRAWPEYFGLLVNIAQLGPQETAILLDMSFLRRALEVISADPELPLHPQYTRMLTIVSKRPITKPVSYDNVIALAEVLLKACDLSVGPIPDEDPRLELLLEEQPVPLSASENQLLTQHWTRGVINILLEKLLMLNQNDRSTQSILVILLHKLNVQQEPIINSIRSGIRKAANAGPAAPYLRAALTYCEHTDSDKFIEFVIQHVTNTTRMLDNADGKEYLRFFKDLLELTTNRAGVSKENFVSYVLEQIPNWAPSLLTYYDATTRTETEDYVQQTVLRYALEQSLDPLPEIQEKSEILQVGRQLGISCLRYLHEEHVRPRVQAVRATLYSIQAVIDQCRRLFDEQSDDDQDVQFFDLFSAVIPALRKLTVEVADDDVSEWENSDDAFSSSEVMESVTELGGVADLTDETQL